MTRQDILAETLARLEAERYQEPRRVNLSGPPPPPPITTEQAVANARLLLDALDETSWHDTQRSA